MVDSADGDVLGFVFVPSSGSGVGRFEFLLNPDARAVEVGTLVRAETAEGPLIGAVVDMRSVGHTADVFMAFQTAELERSRQRGVVMVAEVAVYSSPALRPTSMGKVFSATVADVNVACGLDRFRWAVPCGVVPLVNGDRASVSLDGHSLLGPEAGHLMIGGLSGQAAKTSYASVMLKCALAAGSASESVAALLFNVKGSDLLFLDRPPLPGYELTGDDVDAWRTLGVDPAPFDDVVVYAPTLPNSSETRSLRGDALALKWSLRDVWPYMKYLHPGIHGDEKAASFFADLSSLIYAPKAPIDTFAKLRDWFSSQLDSLDESESSTYPWRSHHRATMMRLRRMLESLPKRCGGLLSMTDSVGSDVPLMFSNGSVTVVDVAGLDPLVQSLVVARTLERVMAAAEGSSLPVDHLVTLVDELNTYAPSGSGGEYIEIRKVLQRVATMGRYAGLSLWGMAQKMSKIDELIRDNAATRALGVTTDAELASGVYGQLTGGLREVLATLPKGQMVLWHYTLRSPTRVSFPRPAWQMGRAPRVSRKSPLDVISTDPAARSMLTAGLDGRQVDDILAGASGRDDAIAALKAARRLDASVLKLPVPRSDVDDANPFGLD